MVLPPKAIHTAAALEKRGLIKRTWRSSGPPVAVVTADGRYYLKHGKHPREVPAAKERLEEDADEPARAPADGVELISRLRSASGKITVPDPAPQTRGRWRAAYYDALHHGHVPEGHKLRWSGRQRGDCVFALVDEEAEKAAQPPPVPAVDVPESVGRPHRLDSPVVRRSVRAGSRRTDRARRCGTAGRRHRSACTRERWPCPRAVVCPRRHCASFRAAVPAVFRRPRAAVGAAPLPGGRFAQRLSGPGQACPVPGPGFGAPRVPAAGH